jgi:PhnB protein
MQVQPYLFFNGRCEEAIEFYRKAVGAELGMLMRWKDCPEKGQGMTQPDDKVMHAALKIGDTTVMASDGGCSGTASFQGFTLSLDAASDAEAERLFIALSDGGQVQMPLGPTFFASKFAMLADKFGVPWMIIHAKA